MVLFPFVLVPIVWQPIHGAPCLFPCDIWDGLQSLPMVLNWISRRKRMNGYLPDTNDYLRLYRVHKIKKREQPLRRWKREKVVEIVS